MPLKRMPTRPHDVAEIKSGATKDIDSANAILQSIYGADARLDYLDGRDGFSMDLLSTAFGEVRLTRVTIPIGA